MHNRHLPSTFFIVLLCLAAILFAQSTASRAFAQETVLYNFTGTDGNVPESGVILGASGNLYGTAPIGGDLAICGGNGCGTVFEIVHNAGDGWSERTIYTFAGGTEDGASPYSALVLDPHGHLFGMTYYGGTGSCSIGQFPGCGTVFELQHNPSGGWKETVLYNFQGGSDGAYPQATLVLDGQGNLYGTTTYGGSGTCVADSIPYGCGTVFKLSPNSDGSWSETLLYQFPGGINGANPAGGLARDSVGTLYGAAGGGLSCGQYFKGTDCGIVYKLRQTPSGWVKSILHRFTGGADGFEPDGSVTLDASGNVYGTTYAGGISSPKFGNGVVYELTPGAGGAYTEAILYDFTGLLDGGYPTNSVVFDTAGNMYVFTTGGGTTSQDYGGGTLDELSPGAGGWTETTLAAFETSSEGLFPYGLVARDAAGNNYGAAAFDGTVSTNCPGGCGLVFEVTP
jgi:uncharacterized repeat protein (TIGR03803 family)